MASAASARVIRPRAMFLPGPGTALINPTIIRMTPEKAHTQPRIVSIHPMMRIAASLLVNFGVLGRMLTLFERWVKPEMKKPTSRGGL